MALKKKGRLLFSTCILAFMILLAGVVVFANDSIPGLVEEKLGSYGLIVEKQVYVLGTSDGDKRAEDIMNSKFQIITDGSGSFKNPSDKNVELDNGKNHFFNYSVKSTGSDGNISIRESDTEREGFELTANYQIEKFVSDGITHGHTTAPISIQKGAKLDLIIRKEWPENTGNLRNPDEPYTYILKDKDGNVIKEKPIKAGESCTFTFAEDFQKAGSYIIEEKSVITDTFQVLVKDGSTEVLNQTGNGNLAPEFRGTFPNGLEIEISKNFLDPSASSESYTFVIEEKISGNWTKCSKVDSIELAPENDHTRTIAFPNLSGYHEYRVRELGNEIITESKLIYHWTFESFKFDDPTKDTIKTEIDNSNTITYVTITNIYIPVGSLKVEKKWDHKENPSDKWPEGITVELMRKDEGDPIDSIALSKPNWTGSFENLPIGTYKLDKDGKPIFTPYVYKVKEDLISDYTPTSSNSDWFTLNAAKEALTITLTNTYEPEGKLTVTKKVSGNPLPEGANSKVFSFTITGPYEYSEKFDLKDGESKTLIGLKPGDYKVTETGGDIPGYTLSVTGDGNVTVESGETTEANITNTYTEEQPGKGSLKITKTLSGTVPEDAASKEFSFTVTGPSHPNGTTIKITGAGSSTLPNLEPGSYTVTENTQSAQITDYNLTVTEGGTVEVTVSPDSTADANITNTYTKEHPGTGSLQVKKSWKDAPAGTNYPEVKIQLYRGEDKYNDPVTLNSKNSWSHTWDKLPIKDDNGNYYTYKVAEEKVPDGYSVSYDHNGITLAAQENVPSASPSNASMRTSDAAPGASQPEDAGDGSLSASPSNASLKWRKPARSKAITYSAFSVSRNETSSIPAITVTNTYEGTDDEPITGELSIKKTVTGNRGEHERSFTFTITLLDEKGNPLPGSYPYDGSKKGTISSGGSITLKHGESVTISALPEGTRYQVVEKEADQGGYTTSSSGEAGTIALNKTAEAAFTNHKPGGGNPGGGNPGGGNPGGGGGKPPRPDPEPTPPSEATPPPTEETPSVPETLPNRPTELPDPNSPDSPDRYTIWDGDVPRTYVKVWNPETEEFMWIPEDEIPLAGMLPKTGDTSHRVLWIFISILSLCGIGALLFVRTRHKHDIK